jgi:hypothetical protein
MDDTSLHTAQAPEAVQRLLDAGWPVNGHGCMDATPLHGAAQQAEHRLAVVWLGDPGGGEDQPQGRGGHGRSAPPPSGGIDRTMYTLSA